MQKAKELTRKPFVFTIDLSKLTFSEDGPQEIQVLPTGKWNHPAYGPIVIDASDVSEFKQNFDKGLRRDIPITEGHETFDEKPAIAWFKELIDKGAGGLWATVEWTKKGKTLLAERAYKYFSPEFYSEYEDPETREIHENVLVGGALTNKPYFREMQAVVLSEITLKNPNYSFNETTMTIKDITSKKVEELSAEEKAFLKEHKEELSTEELATFGSVLEEAGDGSGTGAGEGAGDEGKGGEGEGAGAGEGGEGAGAGEGAGEGAGAGGQANASEKFVKMSASEVKALTDMANRGAQAFAELRKSKIETATKTLVFSEQNSKGKILPKDEAKVFNFMLGLTDAQRKTFAEIVEAIPSTNLFSESGAGSSITEGTAAAELNGKVQKLMSEDKALKYSDAVRKVLASDKALAKRYEVEMTPAGSK